MKTEILERLVWGSDQTHIVYTPDITISSIIDGSTTHETWTTSHFIVAPYNPSWMSGISDVLRREVEEKYCNKALVCIYHPTYEWMFHTVYNSAFPASTLDADWQSVTPVILEDDTTQRNPQIMEIVETIRNYHRKFFESDWHQVTTPTDPAERLSDPNYGVF